jgi:hypothetical protein
MHVVLNLPVADQDDLMDLMQLQGFQCLSEFATCVSAIVHYQDLWYGFQARKVGKVRNIGYVHILVQYPTQDGLPCAVFAVQVEQTWIA